jgi:hypothetical protein
MPLPANLARYQSLLDFLVEAALREIEQDQEKVDDASKGSVDPRLDVGPTGLHRAVDKT